MNEEFDLSDLKAKGHLGDYYGEDVKEFINQCEDKKVDTADIPFGDEEWIRVSDMKKLAGSKLVEVKNENI